MRVDAAVFVAGLRARPRRGAAAAATAAIAATAVLVPAPAPSRALGQEGVAPSCYLTGGGALEICRDGAEAEGVLAAPAPCAFVRGVQIVRLARADAAGPLQAVFQGEDSARARRGADPCPDRRADDFRDAGSVRSGRSPEQLATTLPPSAERLRLDPPDGRRRRDGAGAEGVGPRDPVAVAGRDWAGEAYAYVFLLTHLPAPETERAAGARDGEPRRRAAAGEEAAPRRRVQVAARTLDFERFEVRTRAPDGSGLAWTPVAGGPLDPAGVLDEAGEVVASACAAPAFETHGLAGSISVIERTYHYFYTDAPPEACGLPPASRPTALYLRTATDLSGQRVWSAPRKLLDGLPPRTLVRVARAKGAGRWAVSYSCLRPANAPGGPVADVCLQYTPDLSLDGIGRLKLFAEPVEAGRSPAYLGLRSGGDGRGRFDRSAHFWMTDAHGNLDTPGVYAGKAGMLTWLDRLAPARGPGASSLYGRPAYWATWTVRPVGAR